MSETSSLPPEERPEELAPQKDLRRFVGAGGMSGQRRNRFLAAAFTVSAHIAVFAALYWSHAMPPRPAPSPAPIQVSLLETPKPTPPAPPEPAMIRPGSPRIAVIPLPLVISAPDDLDLLSDSQLAGAAAIGEGGGGGSCDMGHAVQQALRRDPLVRIAVEGAHRIGKAIILWNGDWVRSGEEEGKGLSAVREAISWEVAFAPEACRNKQVHGLVLLSLADGSTRFALGTGEWHWSDLLGVRRTDH